MFKKAAKKSRPYVKSVTQLFHGIEVVPGAEACQAARAILGHRYLSDEAPRLPLESCSKPRVCRCVYRHYRDRRTDIRRESDVGLPVRDVPQEQRLRAGGRRITD
jgi:hypothetical protein